MAAVATAGRDWRGRAACLDEDPELFFPVGHGGPGLEQVARAKAVCARCPVSGECLSFALVAVPEGVAGGLTGEERRALRARGGQRAPGLPAAGAVVPERLPGGVDGLVVASLVAGQQVPGASRRELAYAAVGLYEAGHKAGWIAEWFGVHDQQVYRWLARQRAGVSLTPTDGRPGGRTGGAAA